MSAKKPKKDSLKTPSTWSEMNRWSIALVLFAFLLNLDTIRYEFTFDDPLVVSQNKFVNRGWTSIPRIFATANLEGYNGMKESNYRPVSISLFAIERSILGTGPRGYHFMHVLYYALTCLLVFKLLLLLFKGYPLWLSVGVTALFVAHPLHTEVVANLKSRDEITSLIGIALTLILLLNDQRRDYKHTLLIFLTSFLAFFSKESALPLVLVAPLTVYFFNPNGLKSEFKSLLAVGLSALLYLWMRHFVADIPGPNFYLEDNALFAFELPERYMAAMALIAHYAWLFLFPLRLRADYSFDQLQLTGWSDMWSYAGLLILSGALYIIIRGLKTRSMFSYAWWFSALFYIVTSNIIVMTGATLAERFMFVPSLGLLILLGLCVFHLSKKYKFTELQIGVFFVMLTTLYCIRTLTRNSEWKNNTLIYAATLRDCPRSIRALTKQARFKYDEAMLIENPIVKEQLLAESNELLRTSISISPQFGLTHLIQGMIHKEHKNYMQAIAAFKQAIAVRPDNGIFDLHLGQTYSLINADSLANIFFQRAEQKGLQSILLNNEMAKYYFKQKQYLLAIQEYKKLIEQKPGDVYALSQITKIYRDQLQDLENAQRYNDLLKLAIDSGN